LGPGRHAACAPGSHELCTSSGCGWHRGAPRRPQPASMQTPPIEQVARAAEPVRPGATKRRPARVAVVGLCARHGHAAVPLAALPQAQRSAASPCLWHPARPSARLPPTALRLRRALPLVHFFLVQSGFQKEDRPEQTETNFSPWGTRSQATNQQAVWSALACCKSEREKSTSHPFLSTG